MTMRVTQPNDWPPDLKAKLQFLAPVCYAKRWVAVIDMADEIVKLRAAVARKRRKVRAR